MKGQCKRVSKGTCELRGEEQLEVCLDHKRRKGIPDEWHVQRGGGTSVSAALPPDTLLCRQASPLPAFQGQLGEQGRVVPHGISRWPLKLLRPRTAELSQPWHRPSSQLVLVCFQRPFHKKHLLLEVWDISALEKFLGISAGLLVPNVLALIS